MHARTRRFVHNKLIQARDLARAARTEEVALEEVRLHALLAEQRPAARRLHRVAQELPVDRARERRVRRRAIAHVRLGEPFVPRDLFLP